jgi:transcriptional regulator with XRE-family HTH domain
MGEPTFGDELRRLREEHGLSLKKFAQVVHYDPGYLSKIENSLKPPTVTLAKACDAALDTDESLSALVPAESVSSRVTFKGENSAEELPTGYPAAITLKPSSAISDGAGWAVTLEAARELLAVARYYRRAYCAMPTAALLEASRAHLSLVLSLQPAWQTPPVRRLLIRSVGESAILTAALLFTDHVHYAAALPYLALAQDAARENGDPDLTAVILACRAFLVSFSGGNPTTAADFADAAVDASIDGASPTTRGWVAAVSSEHFAILGDERQSRVRLDAALDAVNGSAGHDQAWAGIGTFDSVKVTAYEGGNLVRLGRYRDAVAVLDTAVAGFDTAMSRHRCTALIDRAEAYLAGGQVEASCDDATAALSIALRTEHALNMQRVHRIANAVLPTKAVVARRLWADVLAATSTLQKSASP